MTRILVTPTSFREEQNREAQELLSRFTQDVVFNTSGKPLQGTGILSLMDGVDGYIAGLDYITADVVQQMPDTVKVISRYGAGFDRVDINACRERGIVVTNTPGVNATAVCELAFGLMLAVSRQIPALHSAVEKGEWPRSTGVELSGKTLGIVGLGAIGKKLAARALAFEMKVLAYDPWIDAAYAEKNGIEVTTLEDLTRRSDVISLHVPRTEQTYHMIDRDRIRSMKDGVIVINTARGGLIEESAAAEAVRSGKIRGLGLDAFEQEPLTDSPLLGLSGVVFTPHTGAHTNEAIASMGRVAVQNLIDVLSGTPCRNIVC